MAMYKKAFKKDKEGRGAFKPKDKGMDFMPPRKKFCRFCVEKVTTIDYKDVRKLEKFVSERYKILSRKMSGTCAKHQRRLSDAVKLSRYLGLLPYVRV